MGKDNWKYYRVIARTPHRYMVSLRIKAKTDAQAKHKAFQNCKCTHVYSANPISLYSYH